MNEEQRKAVIEGLDRTLRELRHWEFMDGRDRITVENMRENITQAVKLIYEQENIIKALMGDYGDSSDVEGCDEQE